MPATRGKKKSDYEKQLEKTKKAVQKVKDTKAALDKAVKKRKAKKRPPMPVALPKPKDKVRKSKAYDNQLEKTKKAVQKVKDTKYKLQLEKTAKAVQKVKDTKYKAQLEKTAKAVQKVKDTKAALKPKNAAKKAVPKRKKFSDDVSDVKTKAPTIKKGTKITPTFKEIKEKPKKAKAPAKPKAAPKRKRSPAPNRPKGFPSMKTYIEGIMKGRNELVAEPAGKKYNEHLANYGGDKQRLNRALYRHYTGESGGDGRFKNFKSTGKKETPKKIKFNVKPKEVAKRKPAVKKQAQKATVIAPKKRVASIPKVNKAPEPEPDPEASDDGRGGIIENERRSEQKRKRKAKVKAKAEPDTREFGIFTDEANAFMKRFQKFNKIDEFEGEPTKTFGKILKKMGKGKNKLTEKQIDSFGYSWTAKQLSLFDEMMGKR